MSVSACPHPALSKHFSRSGVAAIVAAAIWLPGLSVAQQADTPGWSSEFDGVRIRWTASDLVLSRAGKDQPVFGPLVRDAFAAWAPRGPGDCQSEHSFRLIAVVGPLVSVEQSERSGCDGDRSLIDTRLATIDVRQPLAAGKLKHVSLLDYYSDDDVYASLSRDSIIRKIVGDESLKELMGGVYALSGEYNAASDKRGYGYRFAEDFLTRFAFHHVDRKRIAVRMCLTGSTKSNQGTCQQLGFYLPLRDNLARWVSGSGGSLMPVSTAPKPVIVFRMVNKP